MTPMGEGSVNVDEQIGGFEPRQVFFQKPDAFLNHAIDAKRRDFEKTDTALDVDIILNILSAGLTFKNLGNIWSPYLQARFGDTPFDIPQNFADNPEYAEIFEAGVRVLQQNETFPVNGDITSTAIGAATIAMAYFTWIATDKVQKDAYEEWVVARAIKKVALDDNGIDAPELLSAYVMNFNVPDNIDEDTFLGRLRRYVPNPSFAKIRPEFLPLIEEAKEHFREEDANNAKALRRPDKFLHKKVVNLKKGFVDAVKLTKDVRKTSHDLLTSAAISWRLGMPGSITIKSKEIELFPDIDLINIRSRRFDILGQAIKTPAIHLNPKFWRGQRRNFKENEARKPWDTHKNEGLSANIALARATHAHDPDKGEKIVEEIKANPFRSNLVPTVLGQRLSQSEQERGISHNIKEQKTANRGFLFTGIFMGLNALSAKVAFAGAADANTLMATATAATVGGLFSAITYTNLSPLHSISVGLNNEHKRFQDNGPKLLATRHEINQTAAKHASIISSQTDGPDPNNN